MKIIKSTLENIEEVATYIVDTSVKNSILFLRGDLASGKTTLTQAIANYKDIDSLITSPTFSIQQCYSNNLFHYDLYRIEYEDFIDLGLFEEFEKEGLHIVEWGDDRLKSLFESVGFIVRIVNIEIDNDSRIYRIEDDTHS